MTATVIRQAPGWWASQCRAECDDCGWWGPVRDTTDWRGDLAVRRDRRLHRCGSDDYGTAPAGEDHNDDHAGGTR